MNDVEIFWSKFSKSKVPSLIDLEQECPSKWPLLRWGLSKSGPPLTFFFLFKVPDSNWLESARSLRPHQTTWFSLWFWEPSLAKADGEIKSPNWRAKKMPMIEMNKHKSLRKNKVWMFAFICNPQVGLNIEIPRMIQSYILKPTKSNLLTPAKKYDNSGYW